jgi:chemotaxis protein histidine kinase CheA
MFPLRRYEMLSKRMMLIRSIGGEIQSESPWKKVSSMSGCLQVLALLVLVFPIFCNAQSLGEVARQTRAEEQRTGASQARVITNEDLASSTPTAKPTPPSEREENAAKSAPAESKPAKENDAQAKDWKAKEDERQRRTDEINQRYLERIATLRGQLNTAQGELGKLQGSYQHLWELDGYDDANFYFHYQQMLNFNRHLTEVIETQQKLIASLKSQLENLQEEARHAGVPHAED